MHKNLKDIALKLLIIILLLVLSCDKENQEVFNGIFSKKGLLATVLTAPVTSITDSSAVVGGNLTDDGNTFVKVIGICWSTNQNPDTTNSKIEIGNETGEFTSNITRLLKGTTYFLRAYVINNIGIAYGDQVTFTTLDIPTIVTYPVISISDTSAISGGNIISNGGAKVTLRGICWNTAPNPTIANNITSDTISSGFLSSNLTNLTPGTTYYVRAYASNSIGTAYGNEENFTTLSASSGTVTDIDGNVYNTVAIGAQVWMAENLKTTRYNDGSTILNVTDDAVWGSLTAGAISDYGYILYNSTTYGKLYNWYAVDNNPATIMESNYGKNVCPIGWHVPNDSEWVTLITYLGGENNAGAKLKESGTIHWDVPNTGATNDSRFTALPGGYHGDLGSFFDLGNVGFWWSATESSTSNANDIRMYSSNNTVGRQYFDKRAGHSVRCVKGTLVIIPTISSSSISDITSTSATVGGKITNDGGDQVTDRGIYYSTSANAEATGTKLQIGSGIGTFSTSLTGLTPGATYYIKAYATNNIGTAYSDELVFTTASPTTVIPTLSTSAISSITQTSATSGGNITNDGGATVTARGVCWNTTGNPTTANNKTSDGTGVGTFPSSISGLTENTTYYIRAYATNSTGTAYGNEVSFTTLPASSGTVTDIDGNVYNTVVIGTQTWMRENLKTTKYNDGTSIPNVTIGFEWSALTTGAFCYYDNDAVTNKVVYGALYNWHAVNSNKLCPSGWHVPTEADLNVLINYYGGNTVAGGALKEGGTTHWQSPNSGASYASLFNALPGGYRNPPDGSFVVVGTTAYFWGSGCNPTCNIHIILYHDNIALNLVTGDSNFGSSVRCIKD